MNKVDRKITNYKKVISLSEMSWRNAQSRKITSLDAYAVGTNQYFDQFSRCFLHFCTTSYLGLEFHPNIINGAINGINNTGVLRIPNSKNRCKLDYLAQYEEKLSKLFNCNALATLSCSAASAAILPLLASGVFTNHQAPLMVFDKFAHYSMNHMKPACAAETDIMVLPHNDMNLLEDICKKNNHVAYIADGAYSMGGLTKVNDLIYLQNKYNLFLYLDDSHALSAIGNKGCGFVRSHIKELNDKTIVVASLAKAFGAAGGLAMLPNDYFKETINRYGGPSNWSQSLNAASIGAGMASIDLHNTLELNQLQNKLKSNIELFDSLISTEQSGNIMPIRLITCYEDEIANDMCEFLMENGYFTSSVFFPVVPKGKAAIRVTLRSDMDKKHIYEFCDLILKNKLVQAHGLSA